LKRCKCCSKCPCRVKRVVKQAKHSQQGNCVPVFMPWRNTWPLLGADVSW